MNPEERRVERFLHDSTRGLSRRKRAVALAELRSHLHERTNQLILLGKPLPSAQAQAMQELGAPGAIARGLRRTDHVHPLLSAAALAGLAGLLLSLPLFNVWQNWVLNSDGRRMSQSETEIRAEGYWTLPEARTQLAAQGIGLSYFGSWAKLTAPGLPAVKLNHSANDSCSWPVHAIPGYHYLPEIRPSHLYVQPFSLVLCLVQAGWPLEVRQDAVLFRQKAIPFLFQSESTSLSLTESNNLVLNLLYTPAVKKWLSQETGDTSSLSTSVITKAWNARTYRVNRPAYTPVLLLVHGSGDTFDPQGIWYTFLTWVKADQTVQLPTSLQDIGHQRTFHALRLTDHPAKGRQALPPSYSAILLPLSSHPADPLMPPLEAIPLP